MALLWRRADADGTCRGGGIDRFEDEDGFAACLLEPLPVSLVVSLALPNLSLPNLSLPDLSLPDLSLPNLSLADLSLPFLALTNASSSSLSVDAAMESLASAAGVAPDKQRQLRDDRRPCHMNHYNCQVKTMVHAI